MISAEVICDSISEQGKHVTTFKLRYPKFIHGEFMTHRVLSRNASSSRAVPTKKLIEEVRSDELRAAPVFWGKNQPGMQAMEELSRDESPRPGDDPRLISRASDLENAQLMWAYAATQAADAAEEMLEIGVHKQIVNRLLEPFSHINVVATATEWENFFGLRLDKAAQPEMRALAIAMWEARQVSTPRLLRPDQWHLPFVTIEDFGYPPGTDNVNDKMLITRTPDEWPIKVSVARCARVSYESFETGKRSSVEEDLKLHDRLLGAQPLHASPAEHQCTPDTLYDWAGALYHGPGLPPKWTSEGEHGNLVGWRQYRKMLKGEACAPIPDEFIPFWN